jgi:hypothetical protein
MTTIAWDGKVLAGDRLRTHDDKKMPATKVFKLGKGDEQVLVGCAGDSWDCVAFVQGWIAHSASPLKNSRSFTAILVRRSGAVLIDDRLLEHPLSLPFYAIGGGADLAIGAMAAGKGAKAAIEIAARFDPKTGLGVDVVRFDAVGICRTSTPAHRELGAGSSASFY